MRRVNEKTVQLRQLAERFRSKYVLRNESQHIDVKVSVTKIKIKNKHLIYHSKEFIKNNKKGSGGVGWWK